MNHEQIDRMNQTQYQDELRHKMGIYDDVKATLKLCRTMIKALDATNDGEQHSKALLINYLELAQSNAMLAAIGVEIELRRVKK